MDIAQQPLPVTDNIVDQLTQHQLTGDNSTNEDMTTSEDHWSGTTGTLILRFSLLLRVRLF